MIMLPQWFQSLDLIKLRQIPIALRDNHTSSFEYIKTIPKCSPPHKRNPFKLSPGATKLNGFKLLSISVESILVRNISATFELNKEKW